MGLLREDSLTTMTQPHRQLIKLLEECGFEVEVEVSFPPKSVDCYLPEYHIAIEADGPQHTRMKDLDRDAYLMAQYALPVYRVTSEELAGSSLQALQALLSDVFRRTWHTSLVERRMIAWDRGGRGDV